MSQDVRVGDYVQMKKAHPCGSSEWVIYRVGADIGIRCTGCGRHVLLDRQKFNKRMKRIIQSVVNPPTEESR